MHPIILLVWYVALVASNPNCGFTRFLAEVSKCERTVPIGSACKLIVTFCANRFGPKETLFWACLAS